MLVIGIYPLKSLPLKNSVLHTITVHFWHQIMCHVMQCIIIFLYDERKNDSATTAAHSKCIMKLPQKKIVLFANTINTQKNTYGCEE